MLAATNIHQLLAPILAELLELPPPCDRTLTQQLLAGDLVQALQFLQRAIEHAERMEVGQ